MRAGSIAGRCLWLAALAGVAANFAVVRASSCAHWHDGTFTGVAVLAGVAASVGTYVQLRRQSRAGKVFTAVTLGLVIAGAALCTAALSAITTCSR